MIGVVLSAIATTARSSGFEPGFEAEVVRLPEVVDFFDDLPLLVDLDRVHAAVATLVLMLGDGVLKRGVDVAEAMFQDVSESDEHRKADAAELEAIDELLQVDGSGRILGRVDLHVTVVVDREVAVAPASHFIELAGVVHAPGARGRCGRRGCDRNRPPVRHRAHLVETMINAFRLMEV